MRSKPLPRTFYDRSVVQVARELLGKQLIRKTDDGITSGRIVEVEAYKAKGDPACHAARGRTRRNATMFGPPGHAYVYTIHAKFCFNVVTQPEGEPSAVLVRAVEPLDGIELMKHRRSRDKLLDLTRGPARMCEAMALDTTHDAIDLTNDDRLWITDDETYQIKRSQIGSSPRIGISSAQRLKLRYFLRENEFVSGPRWLSHA